MGKWPALTYETLPWEPSSQGSKADRTFRRYGASIPATISELEWRSSAETATVTEAAVAAIVRLDATAGQVLAPLSGFLLRNEAESSSKIEHVQSTPLALARATLGIRSSEAATSTLAAAAAIEDLISVGEETNPADPANLNHAHAILMRPDPLNRKFSGELRYQQNWIGGSDYTPRGALFVPPAPGRVVTLMADLHDFCERKDLPALAQAAIAHAQFETIHPYTDGNGRIGRALLNAVLRYRGVTTAAIVPIASAFMASRDVYFALLGAYRNGEADLFVDYIARCALSACRAASESATTLAGLPGQWRDAVNPRSGSAALKLIDSLLGQPLLTAGLAAERANCTPQAAYNAIAKLEEAGVLRNIGKGSRGQAWAAGDVLDETETLVERINESSADLLNPLARCYISQQQAQANVPTDS